LFFQAKKCIVVFVQNLNDSELVKKYLAGESAVLEELIQRHFRPVFLFAKSYVKTDFEAEDITQETFVKMWKNLKRFDQGKKFTTWLFQIAKNTAIDYLRKHKKIVAAEDLDEERMEIQLQQLVDNNPLPQEIFDQAGFENKLDEIIGKLPDKQRLVVAMHLRDELTFEEISFILGESVNTIKSRYRRALMLVRDNLSKGI